MNRNTKIIAGGTLLMLVAGGIAYASQEYKQYRHMHKMFSPKAMMEKLDTNGDLGLSMDEVMAELNSRFDSADVNSDQKVSKAELVTAIESVADFPRMKRHSGRIADRIVSQLDINEDGNVEKSEMQNRVGKFHALADWNDDGAVEMAEMKKLRDLRMHRGGHKGKGWRHHYREDDASEERSDD